MKTKFRITSLLTLIVLGGMLSCSKKPYQLQEGYIYVQNQERRNDQTKWELVWQDDFNNQKLDTNTWSRIGLFTTERWKFPVEDWKSCKNCFRYINATDPRVVTFDDENIKLNGIINHDTLKGDPRPYLTGGIYSSGKFAFQYGRIEIRAKVDQAYGMWPALWMLSENEIYKDQHNGEMDILEKLNHDDFAYQTTHNHATIHDKLETPKKFATPKIDTTGYNVYSVSWYPDSLVYAVNGVKSYTYPKVAENDTKQWPFDQPFYLIFDQQMEHVWPGKITNPEELPISMYIDWVRIYQ